MYKEFLTITKAENLSVVFFDQWDRRKDKKMVLIIDVLLFQFLILISETVGTRLQHIYLKLKNDLI